jgi:assimilatory nitrate reductase catalytic subunit
MAMHYPETNQLTFPFFDPESREPSYKYAAVRVESFRGEGSQNSNGH